MMTALDWIMFALWFLFLVYLWIISALPDTRIAKASRARYEYAKEIAAKVPHRIEPNRSKRSGPRKRSKR